MDSAHSLALSGVRSIKDKVAEFLVYQCMLKTRWMAYSLHITMHVFVRQSDLTQIVSSVIPLSTDKLYKAKKNALNGRKTCTD